METKIIKGDLIQQKIFTEVKTEISAIVEKFNRIPGIAFIGFSGIPLGKYNIPLHISLAEKLGFKVYKEIMPENTTEEELFELIDKFNHQPDVNAIVLLQPLPAHLIPIRIVNKINPEKEVEGFHPQNMMGNLIPEIQSNNYPMCLPAALFEMFKEAGMQIQKDHEWLFVLDDEFFTNSLTYMIVRAAASKVVPKDCPVAFINKNSDKLIEHSKRADFLVIVTKNPEYFQPEWLKPGVCIIDIYSNLVKEVPSKNDPNRLVPVIRGGVNVKSVEGLASAILPIPGGLMTVVMAILFQNVLLAFKKTLHN
jgi:methylenetetrahydrofolate dehydrogenase (NADP+)/methenyltetrahydrofolate cyclohydrolase